MSAVDAPAIVIPNWNGRRWLPGCLRSIGAQSLAPSQVIVVDNGSTDESVAYLRAEHPAVELVELPVNVGFAAAANRGLRSARAEAVALVNTDVELEPDWLERLTARLAADPVAAAVACKMLELGDRTRIYDAGDVLRRDGACDQRGRFEVDDGRWDQPGEVFGACAGAALYRSAALATAGGFDERYFAYLEDVDLALRLRLAGWRCLYEPAVAHHAGGGSSHQLPGGHHPLVARNTLLLVASSFPTRWLPLVSYRQAAWLREAARERRLLAHLRALAAGLALAAQVRARGEHRERWQAATVPIELAIPHVPIRRSRKLWTDR